MKIIQKIVLCSALLMVHAAHSMGKEKTINVGVVPYIGSRDAKVMILKVSNSEGDFFHGTNVSNVNFIEAVNQVFLKNLFLQKKDDDQEEKLRNDIKENIKGCFVINNQESRQIILFVDCVNLTEVPWGKGSFTSHLYGYVDWRNLFQFNEKKITRNFFHEEEKQVVKKPEMASDFITLKFDNNCTFYKAMDSLFQENKTFPEGFYIKDNTKELTKDDKEAIYKTVVGYLNGETTSNGDKHWVLRLLSSGQFQAIAIPVIFVIGCALFFYKSLSENSSHLKKPIRTS